MTEKRKVGRPAAGGEVTQIRLPGELKSAAAVSAEALETTMSNLIATCLARIHRTEGLSVAYVRELGNRVQPQPEAAPLDALRKSYRKSYQEEES